jgi:integrase
MKGSVTKYAIAGSSRPRWRYRIDAGTDETGRRIQEGRGGFAKEGEAETAMKRHIAELQDRVEVSARAAERAAAPAPKTLGAWLREWLDTYAPARCQPKTLERYRGLAAYITEAGGPCAGIAQTPLAELKHAPIEAALYALMRAKGKRRQHISARSVRHVAGVLNVALNKAFRLDLIAVNPMLRVELPNAEAKDAFSLTMDQIQALRAACRGDWTFALIEVALATGARRGEILALQWADIDWATSTLTISRSLEQTKAGLRIKKPKSNKQRAIRLPQWSGITVLQFLRSEQREQRRLFAGDYRDNDLVFCQPDGRYLEPDLISQVIVRRMRKAGIEVGSLHTLRHTHTSILLSLGVPLSAISARLGHSDTNVTARIYAHAIPADDQRAADAWDSALGSANGNRTRIRRVLAFPISY